ncbi:di-heme oxidoredictase family protein [Mesorhizobium sp. CAU 1732]|uniref:di-heme oxidoreductase family protein n=1 Tax=Mesorhizobium sp. CAU 1732 TaxID=3140358 RepID=UPI003260D794
MVAPARDDLSPEDSARVEKVTHPTDDFTAPERFEAKQGGAATTGKVGDANALSHPSQNLSFDDQQRFLVGNGLFRKDWVTAPSSTQASDGLGPLFNARSCQGCHIKDGRGHAPLATGADATSLLVRLSVPSNDEQAAAIAAGRLPAAPHPVYGLQLQDNAAAGLKPEGKVHITYEDIPVTLAGGEVFTLRKPTLQIANPGYGALPPELMTSARVAPAMAGMGLLEAIHEADILALSDPKDSDGDGISGRPNMVGDGKGGLTIGRFGWKAVEPNVEQQTAHAFSGDMGLSSPVAPDHWGECTQAQTECRAMPHGAQAAMGDEEVPRDLLDFVVFYSRNLAPPARRNHDDAEVLAGKQVFYESGCVACHIPKFVTSRAAGHEAQRFQLIWPYTDLLLHDMGDGLSDGRPEGLADGNEWRTPPLWGIGLASRVSAEAGFLHDGRARSLTEAILWHGGEAQRARDIFAASPKAERDALLRFLESL